MNPIDIPPLYCQGLEKKKPLKHKVSLGDRVTLFRGFQLHISSRNPTATAANVYSVYSIKSDYVRNERTLKALFRLEL